MSSPSQTRIQGIAAPMLIIPPRKEGKMRIYSSSAPPSPSLTKPTTGVAYFYPNYHTGVLQAFSKNGEWIKEKDIPMVEDEKKTHPLSEERREVLKKHLDLDHANHALVHTFHVRPSIINTNCNIYIDNEVGFTIHCVTVPIPSREWTIDTLLQAVQLSAHPITGQEFVFFKNDCTNMFSEVHSFEIEHAQFTHGRVIRKMSSNQKTIREKEPSLKNSFETEPPFPCLLS